MSKVGRNDPCPCGSGKKYKKCHLQTDLEQESARQAELTAARAVAPPDWPYPPIIPLSNEPSEPSELWQRFEELTDDADMHALFREALSSSELSADDALSMLTEMHAMARTPDAHAELRVLMAELQATLPDLYEDEVGHYQHMLIDDALAEGRTEDIPALLEPYVRVWDRFPRQFDWNMVRLCYHGLGDSVHDVLRRVYPEARHSTEIPEGYLETWALLLVKLTAFEYIRRHRHPDPDAPALQAELAPLPYDRKFVHVALEALSGRTVPTLDSFRDGTDRPRLLDGITWLTLAWAGDLYRHHDVPLERADLGCVALGVYLIERTMDGPSGSVLLLPEHNLLDMLGERAEVYEVGEYGVASLIEYLPLYIDFLFEHGLISAAQAESAPADIDVLREFGIRLLEDDLYTELAGDLRQHLNLQSPPVHSYDGGLAEPLLTELRQAGQEPDRALLDRIKPFGTSIVPTLIAMATDPELHYARADMLDVWAPVHAVQLLGELQAVEAIEALSPMLAWTRDDYLQIALQEAFGSIGESAIDPLLRWLEDIEQSRYTRAYASNALVEIAQQHPDARERIVALLVSTLDPARAETFSDPTLLGFLIGDLAYLPAPEALEAIQCAYNDERVDEFVIRMEDVEMGLGIHPRERGHGTRHAAKAKKRKRR